MTQNESDVLILKPTTVFLSLLSEALPDVELPNIKALQTDHTAYTICKKDSDEETLDEIERQFPAMFRYEIRRLLGNQIAKDLDVSFLDFLCCFKFELHSQVVVMEPSINHGQQLLCIKPRSVLVKWMKSTLDDDQIEVKGLLNAINWAHVTKNSTVLVKNFSQLAEIKPFIKHYYRPIFKAEMLRLSHEAGQWPDVLSFQDFNRYFAVEVHTQLVHLH